MTSSHHPISIFMDKEISIKCITGDVYKGILAKVERDPLSTCTIITLKHVGNGYNLDKSKFVDIIQIFESSIVAFW